MTKVVPAAELPAASVVASGWAMGVAGGLILTLAVVVFVLVVGVGLFLILRIEHGTHEFSSGQSEGGRHISRLGHMSRGGTAGSSSPEQVIMVPAGARAR